MSVCIVDIHLYFYSVLCDVIELNNMYSCIVLQKVEINYQPEMANACVLYIARTETNIQQHYIAI